jgi:hypothetical protein
MKEGTGVVMLGQVRPSQVRSGMFGSGQGRLGRLFKKLSVLKMVLKIVKNPFYLFFKKSLLKNSSN